MVTNFKLNNMIIQRLIIERRTATPQRQKEINNELNARYDIKYVYLVSGKNF